MSFIERALARYVAGFKHVINDNGPEIGGSITHSFINNSHADLVVIDRNNETILVERAGPGVNSTDPGLTIKMTRTHTTRQSSNAVRGFTASVAAMLGFMTPILKDTLAIAEKSPPSQSGWLSMSRKFFIPIKDIENNNGIFELGTGLVVTTLAAYNDYIHPDSQEFRTKNQNKDMFTNQPIGRLFEVVDNFRMHRERFVYVGNEVLKIGYTADPERADGLYVTQIESKGGGRSVTHTERFDFEEGFKKFGLFATREEAETSGNPAILHQRTIEDLRQKLTLLERNNQILAASSRAEELVTKRKVDETTKAISLTDQMFTSEMNRLSEQQRAITIEMKERANQDSERREMVNQAYASSLRTTSDLFKYMPTIVAGAAALIGGCLLFFKK